MRRHSNGNTSGMTSRGAPCCISLLIALPPFSTRYSITSLIYSLPSQRRPIHDAAARRKWPVFTLQPCPHPDTTTTPPRRRRLLSPVTRTGYTGRTDHVLLRLRQWHACGTCDGMTISQNRICSTTRTSSPSAGEGQAIIGIALRTGNVLTRPP